MRKQKETKKKETSYSNWRHIFLLRIESVDMHGRSPLDPSISMNDTDRQTTNKDLDHHDDKDDDKNSNRRLFQSSSNIHENQKSSHLLGQNSTMNKTSSNANVFSRLMHSEPHVAIEHKLAAACDQHFHFPILSLLITSIVFGHVFRFLSNMSIAKLENSFWITITGWTDNVLICFRLRDRTGGGQIPNEIIVISNEIDH